jgi:membrane-bound metal-dependent hydrolase YbcI (DUF457 family)
MSSPVGHILSGIIIGSIPVNDRKPKIKRLFLCAFFAAAPDLDMLLVFAGIDYFYAHRTFSHSIVVVNCFSFLLYVLNYFLMIKNEKLYIPWLLILSCLLCHIGIDMLGEDHYGPKGLMILYPLSTKFYYLDLNVFKGLFDTYGNPLPLFKLALIVMREVLIITFLGWILFYSRRMLIKKWQGKVF